MKTEKELKEILLKHFSEKFKSKPLVVSSPGRINLIGEHTDYNNGFVLPAAIDKRIFFAVAPNNKGIHRFYAMDLDDYVEVKATNIEINKKNWANYLLGVIAQFHKKDIIHDGLDCVFGGNVPLGAGLSSSAAIECGFVFAINEMFDLKIDKTELVKMAQLAEHEYAGVKCGIMDQFISVFGKENYALRLDCQTLEFTYYPLNLTEYIFVLCNSMVKHSLASSEYNVRRMECTEGVRLIQTKFPEVSTLRDVNFDQLSAFKTKMSKKVYDRCSYVLEENKRVFDLCLAMENNDFDRFGKLLYASHEGLKSKYEVSCTELDILVSIAQNSKGVMGARMMGGGFGGCTLNLVKKENVNDFTSFVRERYKVITGTDTEIHLVEIKDGSKIENDGIV